MNIIEEPDSFYRLVSNFEKAGFHIHVENQENRLYATSHYAGITFGFCTPNPSTYRCLSGKVTVKQNSTSWNVNLMVLPIPRDRFQFKFLVDIIKKAASNKHFVPVKKYDLSIYGLR